MKAKQRNQCLISIQFPAYRRPRVSTIPATNMMRAELDLSPAFAGKKSHEIILKGIEVLINLTHRGACGCDPETGDGAGILIQIPHRFFARECKQLGFELPEPGAYAAGMVFLPVEKLNRLQCEGIFEEIVRDEGLTVLGWRDTPCDGNAIGRVARASQPYIQQIFIGKPAELDEDALSASCLWFASGQNARSPPLKSRIRKSFTFPPFPLAPLFTKVCCWLHKSRASTGNCPTLKSPVPFAWCISVFRRTRFPVGASRIPFRYVAHNGEINTLRGNVNWMQARQSILSSPAFGDDMAKVFPIIEEGSSDSSAFDNAVELLYQSGRSMPHVMSMLIPESWSGNPHMNNDKRAFYEYHASLMEPWDGPAAIAFTDGRVIGASLDRNGLRPGRYVVTKDDIVVLASEAGVLDIPAVNVKKKGRLQPGKMFLVDTVQQRIISDKEIKQQLASRQPYDEWLKQNQITLDQLPEPSRVMRPIPGRCCGGNGCLATPKKT